MEETCKHIEEDSNEECGQPATATITLRDSVSQARVAVCIQHKAEYNRKAAELRLSRKSA